MDHDAAWKRLFRQPLMVEHLLGGFAPEVAAVLDLATLRDLCASWAAADTEQRHGDAVWRVDYADGSGRSLVVLLEFQSTVDRAMAVRVQRYALMAGETLARTGARDADGELRVLPVVVHAGSEPWTARGAARAVAVTGDGEVQIPPPHVYLLLDAGRIAPEHRPAYNLVSTLFELNGAKAAAEVVAPMRALMGWLPERVECSEEVVRGGCAGVRGVAGDDDVADVPGARGIAGGAGAEAGGGRRGGGADDAARAQLEAVAGGIDPTRCRARHQAGCRARHRARHRARCRARHRTRLGG